MLKPLLILLGSMILLCSACAQEAGPYDLPPSQEEVENLLAKYDLPLRWQSALASINPRKLELEPSADGFCHHR